MKNKLVLFLKTYRGDLEITKIFKSSVDKYNVENIPLFIVVPESDKSLFEQKLRNHNEKYEFYIITDEDVLRKNNITYTSQSWKSQQIIKLGFYKLNYCKNYAIFDSDCYFIAPFYYSDFLLDDKTPYLCIKEENSEEIKKVQNYFHRKGRHYSFIHPGQVFNCKILEDMEVNLLQPNKKNFIDLIEIHPFEYQWYGEWFLKCHKIPLVWTKGFTKVFWIENQYVQSQKNGETVQDFINQGYKAICVQNRWCHRHTYKPYIFYKFIKYKKHIFNIWNHPDIYRKNLIVHTFRFIKKQKKIK